MSAIDDFRRAQSLAEVLRDDSATLLCAKPADLEVKLSFRSSEKVVRDLLSDILHRPETRDAAERIIADRLEKARQAAIAECRAFLEEHVIREVMET